MQIDFTAGGNSDECVISGFSAAELLGRWSMGQMSSVRVPVPPLAQELELRLVVQPITIPEKVPTQTLTILANGVQIHQAQCRGWTEIRAKLPGNPSGMVDLQFLHLTPVTPAEQGDSTDSRPLAFMFKQLSVQDAASTTATPPTLTPTPLLVTITPSPDVRVARDGWLFLIGGTNSALRYYTDPGYFTEDHARSWANLLQARQARLARCGIGYLHMVAPDKLSVYPDFLGEVLPNGDRHPLALLEAALRDAGRADLLVNPLPAFFAHPERERLFLKTDTHWTFLAATVVLDLITQRLGARRSVSLADREVKPYRMIFDLGSKVTPRVIEEGYVVAMRPDVRRLYANELAVKFEEHARQGKPVMHNSINVVFRSENPDAIDKTLVIFGDSFMDFQESTTTALIAEYFRETHFIWSPRIDYGYVARVQADLVLTEVAERFMIQQPEDDYNLDQDVARRLQNYPT